MADYDFEAWAQARVAPSKPNPNQQAASSMRSAGIGGLGGRATTSSAQRIQDSFRDMRENSRTSGSTYDAVPQTITSGLGSPLSFKETEKKDDRNLDQKIYDGMKAFGARLFPPRRESTSDYVLDVYETSPMFRIPTVPEVTEMGIEKSFEQKLQEMFSSQDQNVYTPEIEGTGSYDEVPAPSTNQNLMRNRINSILKDVIAPNSKEYEIQKGDTLSDISLREGVSIDDLAKVNEIENPNMILAGDTLIIPEAQEMEKAKEYVLRVTTRGDENLVDVTDPDRQFYQSGVPMDQRDFAPESPYLDNQPQEREGLMSTDPTIGFEGMGPDPSTGQGIMSPNYDTVEKAQERLNDLGYTTVIGPLAVDGDLGRGTARQLRKFQATAGIPITGELDEATQRELKKNSNRNKEGKDPTAEVVSISEGLFQQIKAPIAEIESGGEADPYQAVGGDADDYDGKYQFGWRAKTSVAASSAIDEEERTKLGHVQGELNEDSTARTAFRNDSNLQEKSFRILVEQNHRTLTQNSQKYRDMTDKQKLAVLGYAHNQGAENALEWLTTSVVGTDAFGTGGDEYVDAIAEAFREGNRAK